MDSFDLQINAKQILECFEKFQKSTLRVSPKEKALHFLEVFLLSELSCLIGKYEKVWSKI